ncbi:unnamed protein product [Rhodiola kirilowii]
MDFGIWARSRDSRDCEEKKTLSFRLCFFELRLATSSPTFVGPTPTTIDSSNQMGLSGCLILMLTDQVSELARES